MTEQGTQPPEGFDPPRCDPVELDTVIEWRDKVGLMIDQWKTGKDRGLFAYLQHLRASMNETIDDCHGLNDPEPEPPVDEDKMKARQHG